MATLEKGSLFQPELVKDLVNKVKGKSSLALMSQQIPVAFNGNKEFTFTMDNDISVVAESGAKTTGGVTIAPVTIVPIKVEYGARVSDEFMYAAEEEKINILKAFNDGFAKKVARGLDLMALHGVNPRAGTASAVIGTNHFDAKVTQTVAYSTANPDADGNIETAVGQVRDAGYGVSGLIMAPAFASSLATTLESNNGPKKYPELAWGANPETINGLKTDINKTVYDMSGDVGMAVIGDFENSFKWGYAKEIPLKVIEYGNPDNDSEAGDLQGHNQVYIRCELYLGWGILDATAFSRIIAEPPVSPLTITLKKGTAVGTSATNAVSPTLAAGNAYFVKINGSLPRTGAKFEDGKDGWNSYTAGADVYCNIGDTIALVEAVSATGLAVKGGVKDVAAASWKDA